MLYKTLKTYNKNIYPFHMPGHKRNPQFLPANLHELDQTEIPGLDNLAQPSGIIKATEEALAKMFGADYTHMLTNGSTCGITAAIMALAKDKDTVILARNCHRSVYNGLVLSGAAPAYIYPDVCANGLIGGVSASAAAQALAENPSAKAVVITSPTYEGFVSDISAMSSVCRKHNVPLVVDEAHGAHFNFSEFFPVSALELGADVVVHSLHKTLPALTQTALLHVKGNAVCLRKLKNAINLIQTTSPSYIFMGVTDFLRQEILSNSTYFDNYTKKLAHLREILHNLDTIHLIGRESCGQNSIFDIDLAKLVFTLDNMCGYTLELTLRRNYGLQMEAAAKNHITAITTIADTDDGFARLAAALQEINKQPRDNSVPVYNNYSTIRPEIALSPREALKHPAKSVPLQNSEGLICTEFIIPYSPGVPLIVPGEVISAQIIARIKECSGVIGAADGTIQILDL